MKRPITSLFLIILFAGALHVLGQEPAQTIRGTVIDIDSHIPLPGANIIIEGTDPVVGTTSDEKGNFTFGKLPLGNYNIKVFYIGYETAFIRNVVLKSGKETVLNIALTESVSKLGAVVVTANRENSEAINKMATVSVQEFDAKAMDHFAGTINDVSRVVSSFAGVAMNPSGANDIIIRGNSPKGMGWRLEGIDIPNPNHYAEEGSSGGGLSIINAAVLSRSDFFTGAFPSEYGNAYSGIFDMKLRNGNNQTREYSLQAGFVGLDCTFEGPFSKKNPASYLVNYRFSSLAMIRALGINLVGDAIPYFQDLTYKITAPTKKLGTFTFFGVGGISKVHEKESTFTNDYETDMGALALKNVYFFNKTAYLQTIVAFTGTKNIMDYSEPDTNDVPVLKAKDNFIHRTPKLSFVFNKKINAKNLLRIGTQNSFLSYSLLSGRYDYITGGINTILDHSGSTTLMENFIDFKHRFNKNVTLVTGIHSMYLFLNKNYTIEPRLGLKWQFAVTQSLSFGFGIHSKMESLSTYYAQQILSDSTIIFPNLDLDFIKAAHFVAGYSNMLNENLLLKVELYYQHLFNVPVENTDTSSFSMLNYSYGFTDRDLINKGSGKNFGVELTLQKYFSRKYYYLITLSLFESKYKALDGILRNTRYNTKHILNLIGGKDFHIGKGDKKRILGVNIKGSWLGGQWTTPIDVEKSAIKGYTVRDESRAFTEQWPDFFRFDFKIYLSRNRKKATHTVEIDVQNITNQLNVIGDYYNTHTGKVDYTTQMGIVPILNYRIEF